MQSRRALCETNYLNSLVHFDFDMRFAPQRRAIFPLSSSQLAGSAPVALASLLFDFRPSGATRHWNNTVFRDFFYLFVRLSSDPFSCLSALTTVAASVHKSEDVGSLTSKLPSNSSKLQHISPSSN